MGERLVRSTTASVRPFYQAKVKKTPSGKERKTETEMPTEAEVEAAITRALEAQARVFEQQLEAQKRQLEGLIQAAKNPPQPQRNHVAFSGNGIPIPTYDANNMTATFYLEEVERYFKSQGHSDDQRLYLMNSIVGPDVQGWLQHIKNQNPNMTWNEFKVSFCSKYDTWFHKHNRMTKLQTRKQKEDENYESFIWEIVRLSQQVFPAESVEDTVRRCRQGLLPKLRTAISELSAWTPENLIERCNLVWTDLQANERREFRYQKVNTNSNGNSSKRNFSRSFGQNLNIEQKASSSQPQRTNPKPYINSQAHANGKTKEDYIKQPSKNYANYECNQCGKMGHIARQCSKPVNTAMMGYGNQLDDQRQLNHCPKANEKKNGPNSLNQ